MASKTNDQLKIYTYNQLTACTNDNLGNFPSSVILTILSHSMDKISDEQYKNICSVLFSTDSSIDSWEARSTDETQTPSIGVGNVVGSGSAVIAGGNDTFDVLYDELINGDRTYQITVYANIGGVWYG